MEADLLVRLPHFIPTPSSYRATQKRQLTKGCLYYPQGVSYIVAKCAILIHERSHPLLIIKSTI